MIIHLNDNPIIKIKKKGKNSIENLLKNFQSNFENEDKLFYENLSFKKRKYVSIHPNINNQNFDLEFMENIEVEIN